MKAGILLSIVTQSDSLGWSLRGSVFGTHGELERSALCHTWGDGHFAHRLLVPPPTKDGGCS